MIYLVIVGSLLLLSTSGFLPRDQQARRMAIQAGFINPDQVEEFGLL